MKKILIGIGIMTIVLVSVWYIEKKKDDPKLSAKQNDLEDLVGEAVLVIDDAKASFNSKEVDFDDKKASVKYGTDNKEYVSYFISDLLQPFNIDSAKDEEYPIILEAKYSDGTFLDNLVILQRVGDKFIAVDQVVIGPANQVDDIHNLANNEVVVDAEQLDKDGGKHAVQLSYTFAKDKIVAGANNIDITQPFVPQIVPTPTSSQTSADSQSSKDVSGKVALSFDDGPGYYSSNILDVLRDKNVKATFFIIGQNVAGKEDILQREFDEGHSLNDHTFTHPDLSKLSSDAQRDEIVRARDAIKSVIAGATIHWLRPPYGSYNDDTLGVLSFLGMKNMLWNVDPRDWSGIPADQIRDGVLSAVTDGSIVLMHDGVANSVETAKALPEIIDGIRAQGYQIVPLSELAQ